MKKLNLITGAYSQDPLFEMAEKINEIIELVSLMAETLNMPGYEERVGLKECERCKVCDFGHQIPNSDYVYCGYCGYAGPTYHLPSLAPIPARKRSVSRRTASRRVGSGQAK